MYLDGMGFDAETAKKTEELIDHLTLGRIKSIGFNNLTQFQQEAVRRAAALIAEDMAQEGAGPGAGAGAGPGADVAAYALADMRVTMRRRKLKPWEEAKCPKWAWMSLMKTGLMSARI